MAQSLCIHNARIYGLQGLQNATALVIEGGVIRYIGDESGLSTHIFGDIEKINAGGRIVFPGFTDTHLHLTEWSRRRDQVKLGGFASLAETCAHIRDTAADSEWLIGGGWNQNAWKEGRFPHRRDLEFLPAGTKAVLFSKDFHTAWVNDAVIDLFDFNDVLSMIRKGYVQRDADGQLNGLVREEGLHVLIDPLLEALPAGIFSDPGSYFRDFYRHGITSVHTMEHCEDYERYLSLYQYEHNRGLRLGVYIYDSDREKTDQKGLRAGSGGPWLRFLGTKIFVDGALGSQTAWLKEPYESGNHVGKQQCTGDELRRAVMHAEARGWGISLHALGDAAVEHVLDILDLIGRDLRVPLRIEHAQLLNGDLIQRIAKRGIALSVNPSHLIDDKPIANVHWGARSRYAYALHSLKLAGVRYGFGSDAPVEDIHPWKSVYAAVMRIGADDPDPWYPEESIRITDAINAFTRDAVLLSGVDERKGVLAPGFAGDCFICDRDVFDEPLTNWRDIHSVLTVIGGRIVYHETDRA
ncbi:MAG: amidohydrolase [Candidatus Marinimicrobia bacterium]|nr:amidohydrolase [Candidatus Neomarinimicrobiota bacterium]